jgi:hypothetical protein
VDPELLRHCKSGAENCQQQYGSRRQVTAPTKGEMWCVAGHDDDDRLLNRVSLLLSKCKYYIIFCNYPMIFFD